MAAVIQSDVLRRLSIASINIVSRCFYARRSPRSLQEVMEAVFDEKETSIEGIWNDTWMTMNEIIEASRRFVLMKRSKFKRFAKKFLRMKVSRGRYLKMKRHGVVNAFKRIRRNYNCP